MAKLDDDNSQTHDLRSFGRRRGRKQSPRQQRLLDDLLVRVAVDLDAPIAAVRQGEPPRETWLEIGFGGGEHLVWQAEHNPNVDMIGCEPFEDGIVKVLSAIEDQHLGNIRVHADDARTLLRRLPAASIARCFVLFPDPWPKKRHVKRRLLNTATLALIARALRPGAELRIGTDIGDYARTMLMAVAATPELVWTAKSPANWRVRPDDWPPTRYEAKAGREGRRCYYFRFVRRT